MKTKVEIHTTIENADWEIFTKYLTETILTDHPDADITIAQTDPNKKNSIRVSLPRTTDETESQAWIRRGRELDAEVEILSDMASAADLAL